MHASKPPVGRRNRSRPERRGRHGLYRGIVGRREPTDRRRRSLRSRREGNATILFGTLARFGERRGCSRRRRRRTRAAARLPKISPPRDKRRPRRRRFRGKCSRRRWRWIVADWDELVRHRAIRDGAVFQPNRDPPEPGMVRGVGIAGDVAAHAEHGGEAVTVGWCCDFGWRVRPDFCAHRSRIGSGRFLSPRPSPFRSLNTLLRDCFFLFLLRHRRHAVAYRTVPEPTTGGSRVDPNRHVPRAAAAAVVRRRNRRKRQLKRRRLPPPQPAQKLRGASRDFLKVGGG
mmetsp:Transcript_6316/g.23824  ORF Transcript_6316/g.23824 Transcript_6316/m.23824 type:complete len:287 (+) Transcript_6316:1657-2517(+)